MKMSYVIRSSICAACILLASKTQGYTAEKGGALPKIAIVSLKECIDNSKLGKHEQTQYESLKKDLEQVMDKKQKEMEELSPKFSEEYMATLSQDAQNELKEKFRNLSQELAQAESQYYQILRETNMQVVRGIEEVVMDAAKKVAADKKIDIVIQEGALYWFNPNLNISKEVIQIIDKKFDEEMAKKKADEKK